MQYGETSELTIEQIAEALAPFRKGLPADQLEAIRSYINTLLLWNEKVSLTAIDDPVEIVRRHFGESIYIANSMDLAFGRLADVGTGAGFPGLALKIIFPDLDVTLIESNAKKSAFLNEVIGELGLKRVEVMRRDYGSVAAASGKFDYICSRALGDYKNLLNWSRDLLNPHGKVILWVGEEESLRLGRVRGWRWRVPEAVPESKKRVILIGEVAV